MNLFLGAGVRVALPLEAFVRSRFLYSRDFSDVALMRLGETLFVKNSDLFGETSEFSLERLVGRDSLLRWASSGTASQEIEGLEWGSELSLATECRHPDGRGLWQRQFFGPGVKLPARRALPPELSERLAFLRTGARTILAA